MFVGLADWGRLLEDREAFVVAAYAGLFRWFCRLSGSADLADDLTQTTFAAFWRSPGPSHGLVEVSPKTWLYAIGRNLWRKQVRDRKSQTSASVDLIASLERSAESCLLDREFREAAELAVGALPADLREAFTLRFWHEFDYEEIGVIQGVSAGLARWRYFAARQRLHKALAAWNPDQKRAEEDHHAR